MSEGAPFEGFPGIGKATAIPNTFFSTVLPAMREPGDLLAFLWVARLVQEQQGDARFVTADQVWALSAAASTFEALSDGRESLERGLAACVELGALLALDLAGSGQQETVYFVNNPASRRAVARARGGDLELRPGAIAYEPQPARRPNIFHLYEEHVGTITPLVAERLLVAAEQYPQHLVESAFREAAERNVRNWKYIERMLQNWSEGNQHHEATGRDSVELRRRRYAGDGATGSASRPR
ncbi:MAG: DnaD domain protein [Dehalococcoidia bacterium]|nr:DnaD domain protein [Dehalococcoidia bacterium]